MSIQNESRERMERFQCLVQQKMQRDRLGYDTAFNLVTKEHPGLLRSDVSACANAQVRMVGLANVMSFSEEGWAMVSPYGYFPHTSGKQRITKEDSSQLVRIFKSNSGRIRRATVGRSIFKGHPDCPSLANQYPDKVEYGMVADLEARDDALYGKLVLNQKGADLVEGTANKYLSPYWNATCLMDARTHSSVFVPCELISVGLTSFPNLPVTSLTGTK